MKTIKRLKVNLRIAEFFFVVSLAIENFELNIVDFQDLSDIYDDPFLPNLKTRWLAVNQRAKTRYYISEVKTLTDTAKTGVANLRNSVRKIAWYLKKASGLTIAIEDFGIHDIREKIRKKDFVGLTFLLDDLLMKLSDATNAAALALAGFKQPKYAAFLSECNSLKTVHMAQKLKMEEKELAVQDNMDEFNAVWDIIDDILEAGVAIYSDTDPEKAKEFTLTYLKNKVRREKKAELNDGEDTGEYELLIPRASQAVADGEYKETDYLYIASDSEGDLYLVASKDDNPVTVTEDTKKLVSGADEKILFGTLGPAGSTKLHVVNLSPDIDGAVTITVGE